MGTTEAVAQFKSLRAAGRPGEGLSVLQQALRRGQVDADGLDQVGRLIVRQAGDLPKSPTPLNVLILGQCTTTWLVPALTALAWGRGRAVKVGDGGYDNVIQDMAGLREGPDVVLLLPWRQRLLAMDDRGSAQRVQDELGFLKQAWEMVGKSGARLVQVGYDWEQAGALGDSSIWQGGWGG
jgi:hypothetical protein